MKTTKINKAYVVFTLFFFMMSWHLIKAQVAQTPYFVNNNSPGCQISVTVEFYDGSSTPCNTFVSSTIAAGNLGTYNAGGACGTLTDVQVILVSVGTATLTTNNVVNVSLQADTCTPFTTVCGASYADIGWSTSTTDVYTD
jgi:hypothetical protein